MTENIKYYLLIVANPLSDSRAAMSVFKTISRLDLLSRNVTFFYLAFTLIIRMMINPKKKWNIIMGIIDVFIRKSVQIIESAIGKEKSENVIYGYICDVKVTQVEKTKEK